MTGRFAPTPSGRMHIGNMTAMLAAWLDSRACGQRMLLRIEDIDTPRVLPDADRWIMDDLDWLGLDWDGEPVYQSQRIGLYEQTLRLLKSQTVTSEGPTTAGLPDADAPATDVPVTEVETIGPISRHPHASVSCETDAVRIPLIYPCFCSRADIRAASAPQEGDGFQIYPGTCRRLMRDHPDEVRARLAHGDRHSLRIAMPCDIVDDAGTTTGTACRTSVAADESAPDTALGRSVTAAPVHTVPGNGVRTFDDAVFGPQSFDLAREIGDSVIRRSDGLFGYQFVVTVDDLAMGVDSIVRGRDLLRSTALQAYIRERLIAAGWHVALPSHESSAPSVTKPTTHESLAPSDEETEGPRTLANDHSAVFSAPSDEGAVSHMLTGGETTRAESTQSTIIAQSPVAAHPPIPRNRAYVPPQPANHPQPADHPTPAHPSYAHIPLIDNAAGRRLAKRERSLDMGALRERGVTAAQVTGVCAWLLRLADTPEPIATRDLLDVFRADGWKPLRAEHADRRLDPDDPLMPTWLADALRP